MSSKCVIRFDNNPLGIYYSGQTVAGTVELTTTKPKTIQCMHVIIKGFAEVRWTESYKKENEEKATPQTFSQEECYLSSQTIVYGQSGIGGSLNLPPGHYTYPFQIMLPPQCPTSMNGKNGQIRYEVVFTIDRHLRYHNVFKQPFTVIFPLDLNQVPGCANPAEKREEHEFCCGFCCGNNNPIIVVANLPQTGYAPGQQINFKVFVDNQSNTDCTEIKAKLYREAKFTSRAPEIKTRTEELKVADTKLGAVPKQTKLEINGSLQVPSTTPSSLQTCNIIKVEYVLTIFVRLSGLHMNINLPFPLTIGTSPLTDSSGGGGGPISIQPGSPSSSLRNPTSYEDDVNNSHIFINNDEYNKFITNSKYIPKYPVYNSVAGKENTIIGQNILQHPSTTNTYPGGNVSPSQFQNNPTLYPSNNPTPYPHNPTNGTPYPPSNTPYPSAQPATNQDSQIGWKM